jgi:hypothetical protein
MNKLFTPQHFLILLVISITIAHCSKKKEEIKTNIVIEAMTSGKWVVQTFSENNEPVTSEFTGYEFQFFKDGTVKAFKGSTEASGTWLGDATALTISSRFLNTNDTLMRLNDTWKILKNSFTYVEARPTNTNRTAFLKLIKL